MEEVIRLLIKHYRGNIRECTNSSIYYDFPTKRLELIVMLGDKYTLLLYVKEDYIKEDRYTITDFNLYKDIQKSIEEYRISVLKDIEIFLKSGIN